MEFKEQVMKILIEKAVKMFGVDPATLGPNTNFKEDLQCKSANIVQFTTSLEDEFDIEVPYMEFNRKATFADAAEYIAELCEE
ncbi:MAG: phosphopantetheine-binding protein [Lachnospiraceae bacterium]|nr:phosphopantetheine-binding protein [Lachnospiraceae bacterium]